MKDLVITAAGEHLMTLAAADLFRLRFTKITTTDQDYSGTDLKALTKLLNERQTNGVSYPQVIDETTIRIYAALDNEKVDTSYYVRAIGIYAVNVRNDDEVLFAVALGDGEGQYDYIPAFNGTNYVGLNFKINIKVTNADIIDITVDPATAPTMAQVVDLENKVNGFDSWKTATNAKVAALESKTDGLETDVADLYEETANNLSEINAIKNSIRKIVSAEYVSTRNYIAGDYCIYGSVLYRCLINCTARPPLGNPSYWLAVNIGDEIRDAKLTVDLNYVTAKNAAAHNSIYRGINLFKKYTQSEILAKINDGSFDDLFVGDYFDISIPSPASATGDAVSVRCVLAGFDLFLNTGDTNTTRHHAVVVTEKAFTQRYQMNADGSTTGGFMDSDMWKTVIPSYIAAFESILGERHLVPYRTGLTNGVSYGWAEVKMSLMSEIQLTGQAVFTNSVSECGFDNAQFPLFMLNPAARITGRGTTARTSYFLKSTATSSNYVAMREDGHLGSLAASSTNGFRPFFLIG